MSRDLRILVGAIIVLVMLNLTAGARRVQILRPAPVASGIPTLRIAAWEDYLAPSLLDEFARTERCRVEMTTFDSNEELVRLLSEEDSRFDVIVPSSYILPQLISMRAVARLDRKQLTNSGNIDTAMDELAQPQIPGRQSSQPRLTNFGVPFVVAQTGIAARTRAGIPREELRTWRVFERPELAGQATLLHDMRESFAAALLANGRGVNETRPENLVEAQQTLSRWLAVAAFNDDTYAAELHSDRLTVAHAYPGDVGHIVGESRGIEFLIPREGASISIEYLSIVLGTENPDLSRKFIDFMLHPDRIVRNMEWSHIRTASSSVFHAYRADKTRNHVPIPSTLEEVRPEWVLRPLPEQEYELYRNLWQSIPSRPIPR
ncbi:MAG: spermidine/putrescine ABC transporter substrate-binding protein [Verrucomicrobiales bacterium]|nr:spermidine/putrescine ABC transporter substrate-binding protein [Verrucomicrobiales bacterium]